MSGCGETASDAMADVGRLRVGAERGLRHATANPVELEEQIFAVKRVAHPLVESFDENMPLRLARRR